MLTTVAQILTTTHRDL